MAQTVIGVFPNADAAQRAADQLTQSGFADADVDISQSSTVTTENPTGEFGENDAFHRFFRAVFSGHPDSDTHTYANAARRGSVVTVHTHTLAEAERARDLLDHAGAANVHEMGIQHRAIGEGGTPVPDPDRLLPGQQRAENWTSQRSRIVERRVDDDLRLR
ncbi:hypothetical protein [Solirubrum puertoriconensis]|uniref:General stress protein 17M-like domain-containing protein n=1 Tax=Solirubrum puertoriconensis TaxID=1751427 RepID=A0A9X0HLU2_SOLP1|nr:hypothetical protein [Solirubrum puertoriconensis]KUG08322.1 hypothetical protein ASU33_09105 [Solirubrum puertoriconensis]